jgi:hypothetical protein
MLLSGITNCLFRLISGFLADFPYIRKHRLLGVAFGFGMSGVLKLLVRFLSSYLHTALYAASVGVLMGK